MSVPEDHAERLHSLQRQFEQTRDGVWVDRIGAGLAYRNSLRKIDEKVEESRRERDAAVVAAVEAGGSYREVAKALGLSHSRVQQIIGAARDAAVADA
jgi:DNA invertase Pin-like site-specific DNA recombinase